MNNAVTRLAAYQGGQLDHRVTGSCFGKGLSLLTVPVLPYDILQE